MENYKRVIFHHIPKTAGQSITSQLRSYFRETEIYKSTNIDRSDIKSENFSEEFITKKLVCAHIWSPIPDHLLESSFLFTFFRNPYEQILSNIKHVLREKENFWHKAIVHFGHNIALRDLAYVFCNHQTRCCHRFLYEDADGFERREGYDSPFILERVMDRISRYNFIGTVERFDVSSCIIGEEVGISFDGKYVKNAAPEKSKINFDLDEFFSSNSLDISLYGEASKSLEIDVLELRNKQIMGNSLLIRLDEEQEESQDPKIYFGPGWSESVPYKESGVCRWIVGKYGAYLSFITNKREVCLSIKIVNSHINIKNEMEIIINGVAVPFSTLHKDGEVTICAYLDLPEISGVHSALIKTKNWKSFYEIDNSILDLTPRSIAVSEVSLKQR